MPTVQSTPAHKILEIAAKAAAVLESKAKHVKLSTETCERAGQLVYQALTSQSRFITPEQKQSIEALLQDIHSSLPANSKKQMRNFICEYDQSSDRGMRFIKRNDPHLYRFHGGFIYKDAGLEPYKKLFAKHTAV